MTTASSIARQCGILPEGSESFAAADQADLLAELRALGPPRHGASPGQGLRLASSGGGGNGSSNGSAAGGHSGSKASGSNGSSPSEGVTSAGWWTPRVLAVHSLHCCCLYTIMVQTHSSCNGATVLLSSSLLANMEWARSPCGCTCDRQQVLLAPLGPVKYHVCCTVELVLQLLKFSLICTDLQP